MNFHRLPSRFAHAMRLGLASRLAPKLGLGLALACAFCLLLLAVTPPAAYARGPAVAGSIALASLPREGRQTYGLIRGGGPFPFPKDGITFGNYEGALPQQKRGYYHEYTVPTPGSRSRGARRIVCGGPSADFARRPPVACYYTGDHYATFREIRE